MKIGLCSNCRWNEIAKPQHRRSVLDFEAAFKHWAIRSYITSQLSAQLVLALPLGCRFCWISTEDKHLCYDKDVCCVWMLGVLWRVCHVSAPNLANAFQIEGNWTLTVTHLFVLRNTKLLEVQLRWLFEKHYKDRGAGVIHTATTLAALHWHRYSTLGEIVDIPYLFINYYSLEEWQVLYVFRPED